MIFLSDALGSPLRAARRFVRDKSGVALTEFAFSLPILMIMMTGGVELASYVTAIKRSGNLAMVVADNASRMGTRSATLNLRRISEAEINDVLIGASMESGIPDIRQNGKIVLTSLQRNADGGQWIAWQRCFGENVKRSDFGRQGDGATGTSFPGLGPANARIQAPAGTAVMVVEIFYNYDPLVPIDANLPTAIKEVAVFNVRESRDLNMPTNAEGVAIATCT
ncbi:MAG: TadE/TadG family type IV pilus assembly protein [Erythrobacter sp.]